MIKYCWLIAVLFLVPISSPAWTVDRNEAVMLLAKAEFRVEHAIRRVKKRYPGKILKAERIKKRGSIVFKVKILMPKGRIKNVFVDGITGEIFEP